MKVLNYASAADEIEQLEAKLQYAEEERAIVTKRMIQLEQDLGAVLAAIKKADVECDFCVHNIKDAPCDAADCDCSICTEDCVCKTCRDNSNWQWRGNKI